MTITITLENHLEQWLKDYSEKSGMSPEEAVKDLLERLKNLGEDESLQGWSREELRREIQQGFESGESTPWNVDEFLEEAHARYKTR